VRLHWGYEHGKERVPAAVQRRVVRANKVMPFLAVGLLCLSVLGLLRSTNGSLRTLGFTGDSLLPAVGAVAGLGKNVYVIAFVVIAVVAGSWIVTRVGLFSALAELWRKPKR
jgi:membrane protein DedA with SNARE-associated domain